MRAMRRAACPQAAADVCHSGKVRGSPPHIQTAKGAAAISRRGGFYIRPGWFPQAGAFVRLRAGHARPLQGCNSPGRDDLFADVCHSGKVRGSPLEGAASPTPRGGVRAPRPTYKPQKGRQRFPVAVMLQFFALRTKKSPTVRSRERWGQNAISRPLKRRRAKRQNGGAACYWQEPHRRGKQPVDGSRLVMVSRR